MDPHNQSISNAQGLAEIHPGPWQARLVRTLRRMQKLRGWRRLTRAVLPAHLEGEFQITNKHGKFAGNLNSFIDRELYLAGGYEEGRIDAFVKAVKSNRQCVSILDVGANIGVHSVAFANTFKQVHAFEPNPDLWNAFEANISINHLNNVHLHKLGLSDQAGRVPFYSIAKDNQGLGTALAVEQYDLPLQQIGSIDVQTGDHIVEQHDIRRIDAVKIDVQGLEPQVLTGLKSTLRKHRPVLWVEVGVTTAREGLAQEWLRGLISEPIQILRFNAPQKWLKQPTRLVPITNDDWSGGDYVIIPS